MMVKDIDLVLDRARGAGVTLPFTQELRRLLEETVDGGYARRRLHGALRSHRRNGRQDMTEMTST